MLFFNKTTRAASAAVISTLALAGSAFAAFQSGYDVGAYCDQTSSTQNQFTGCCNGGCAGMHNPTTDSTGYHDCVAKCMTYLGSS